MVASGNCSEGYTEAGQVKGYADVNLGTSEKWGEGDGFQKDVGSANGLDMGRWGEVVSNGVKY